MKNDNSRRHITKWSLIVIVVVAIGALCYILTHQSDNVGVCGEWDKQGIKVPSDIKKNKEIEKEVEIYTCNWLDDDDE